MRGFGMYQRRNTDLNSVLINDNCGASHNTCIYRTLTAWINHERYQTDEFPIFLKTMLNHVASSYHLWQNMAPNTQCDEKSFYYTWIPLWTMNFGMKGRQPMVQNDDNEGTVTKIPGKRYLDIWTVRRALMYSDRIGRNENEEVVARPTSYNSTYPGLCQPIPGEDRPISFITDVNRSPWYDYGQALVEADYLVKQLSGQYPDVDSSYIVHTQLDCYAIYDYLKLITNPFTYYINNDWRKSCISCVIPSGGIIYDAEEMVFPRDISTNLFYYKGFSNQVEGDRNSNPNIYNDDEVIIINARKMYSEPADIDQKPIDSPLRLNFADLENTEVILTSKIVGDEEAISKFFNEVHVYVNNDLEYTREPLSRI